MKKGLWFLVILISVLFVAFLSGCPKKVEVEPVVVAVPTSLGSLEGEESLNSVNLAVDEINAQGGIDVGGTKRPFKVESIDLRDAAAGVPVPEALLGLEKIILEKKPAAIVVGPFRSEALLAGMDLIAKHKVPMLGSIAMSPGSEAKIKKDPDKYKYVFRVSMNVIYWVKLLAGTNATLKNQFGFDKVYIMNQDVAWARGTAGGMAKMVYPKLGMEVVGHDEFPTGFSDFSAALMKAKNLETGVIFACFDMPESGVLVNQWRSIQVPALIAGFISPMAGEVAWKTFDGKIGGLMNAIFELGNMPSDKYAPAKNFYNAYKEKYGKGIQAGHGPAPSYEAVYILKEAIERAGSLDPDAIVTEIEKTDRKGVMGRIKFDEGHQVIYGNDPAEAAVGAFFQWSDDGIRKIVYPKSIAEGEIVLPTWVTKR
ncbi:MAG: ABC transporter substrate-binding protein [Desulfobacterales bacterium]|nr:ABC transporter substrate-binding protein [Desulfobacterales bacterium]